MVDLELEHCVAGVDPQAPLGVLVRAILEARGTPLEDFLREVKAPWWDVVGVLAGWQRLPERWATRFAWLLGGTPTFWLERDALRADEGVLARLRHLAEAWQQRVEALPLQSHPFDPSYVVAVLRDLIALVETPRTARPATEQ